MADKKSWETFKTLSEVPYWNGEYAALFAPDCELELPYAPPGMPQYISATDRPFHYGWLERTTKDWTFFDIQPYGAPADTDVFWLMRKARCQASWGGLKDQEFYTRFIVKVTIRDGLVRALREYSDPLAYLRASGREVPIFEQNIDPKAAEAEKPLVDAKRSAHPVYTDPPEVCEARKQKAINALAHHRLDPAYEDDVLYAENMDGLTLFAPPQMDENSTPHRQYGHTDWVTRSCISGGYTSDDVPFYATGDPDVYFDETSSSYLCQWLGYPPGGYRNVYVDRIVFDHGYLQEFSEALNPINKFNSINVSLPSFPYYYD